jgi:signal transduction histidine kinase
LSFVKKVAEESGGQVSFLERTTLGGAGFEITLPDASLELGTEPGANRLDGSEAGV